jgi:hypothetical protein
MARRTVMRELRDDPEFAAMYADVEQLRKAWPGTHSVAYRDEQTGEVTFHLHVQEHDLGKLRDLLGQVQVTAMHGDGIVTYHFHGRRQHMDALLKQVAQ